MSMKLGFKWGCLFLWNLCIHDSNEGGEKYATSREECATSEEKCSTS